MTAWINRHRNILDLTLSSLLRRKAKNLLLVAAYTLVVFLLASVLFFVQAIKREAAVLLKDAPEIVVQKLVAGRHDLVPAGYIETIRGISGVSGVQYRLWGYYYEPVSGANFTLMVPPDQPPEQGSIRIGSGVSRITKTAEGDMYPLNTLKGSTLLVSIAGILTTESELLSADLVLMSEPDFRAVTGVPKGLYTDIAVTVANSREIDTIAKKITTMLPGTRPVTRSEILRTYDAVFDWRSGIVLAVLSCCGFAFLIFAWDRATALSGEERREIGILKAVGWETSDVMVMKFWEGAVISLVSFFAGVLLAYIHVFIANSPLFIPLLKGWSVLYPEFRLTPHIGTAELVILLFLSVVPYTVSTIVPAWRAATIDPDSVMR